jgi:RNA polymerase sigma-70 factor (ECF subfamily)
MPEPSPTSNAAPPLADLIAAARGGSSEALGRLLESCRRYLLLLANHELKPALRAKLAASDAVQDAFAEAQRNFAAFRGSDEQQLLAWLRGVLLHNLADTARRYERGRRQLARETSLDDLRKSGQPIGVPSPGLPPAEELAAREQAQALARAVERLPEAHRLVIHLRYTEHRTFEEIGAAIGRSPEAARKLWFRAVERLRQEMGAGDDDYSAR